MKEFFIECLKNLKDIAGIQQLHWLMQECKDQAEFDKRKEIIVESMMVVSRKFDYIPEEKQQAYIEKMMREDQQYDSLNSRTIWKWLDMHKGNHITHSQFDEEALTQHEPCSPEKFAEYMKQWEEALSKIGNPQFVNGMADLRKRAGFEVSLSANQPRPEWIVGDTCPQCKGFPSLESEIECEICEGVGKINCMKVNASSQAEADKAYQSFK